MTVYKEFRVGGGSNPLGFLGPVIILALLFFGLYFLAKGIFNLLMWAAPVILIATLVLDYTVFTDFFRFLIKLLKENTIMGILAAVLTFFGFPFVLGYLFLKAIMRRSVKTALKNAEKERNTYTEYVEVKEDKEDESFLELPPLQKSTRQESRKDSDSPYDELFK